LVPVTCALCPVPCTEHLASQPAENEFQIFNQDVGKSDFVGGRRRRKAGLHKQARERLGEPLGKPLDIFRLNFLGLGLGNSGLQLGACPTHGQRGENRGAAEQHGQTACRQHHLLDIRALDRALEVCRFGYTIA
jgi:hypothetical protein